MSSHSPQRLSPDHPRDIYDVANRFAEAQGLLAAVELGLFTALDEGGASVDELCRGLGLDPRPAADFLHLLIVLGLIEEEGDKLRNSAAAQRFLVDGKPDYLGSSLGLYGSLLYPSWSGIAAALRGTVGDSGDEPKGDDWTSDFFATVSGDPEALEKFLEGSESENLASEELMTDAVDWSVYRSVLDVGGARGRHASHIARIAPHLKVGVFDLPPLAPFFEKLMASRGVSERTDFHAGDFFTDDLPAADVVLMAGVLHNWSPDVRRMLVGKAAKAVNPGGLLLVLDKMQDDRRTDKANLITSLTIFLSTRGGGSKYTESECRAYLTEAGFDGVTARPFGAAGHVLVTGGKPR